MNTYTQETIRAAELAMGSSSRIMEEWMFQKRMGWHHYWTPDRAVQLAANNPSVTKLVWC